jgi:hypothetical protein
MARAQKLRKKGALHSIYDSLNNKVTIFIKTWLFFLAHNMLLEFTTQTPSMHGPFTIIENQNQIYISYHIAVKIPHPTTSSMAIYYSSKHDNIS